MTSAIGPRIAIIGAGFSGSLLAVQLLKRALPNGRIYLIEKNAQFGGGLAYSTGNANHLLNVRASRMSAFVDEPDHFTNWLQRRDTGAKRTGRARFRRQLRAAAALWRVHPGFAGQRDLADRPRPQSASNPRRGHGDRTGPRRAGRGGRHRPAL